MSQADTVSSVSYLIDKDMVKESVGKMKNGEAAGPSGVVSEVVKYLVYQMIKEEVILPEKNLALLNKWEGDL